MSSAPTHFPIQQSRTQPLKPWKLLVPLQLTYTPLQPQSLPLVSRTFSPHGHCTLFPLSPSHPSCLSLNITSESSLNVSSRTVCAHHSTLPALQPAKPPLAMTLSVCVYSQSPSLPPWRSHTSWEQDPCPPCWHSRCDAICWHNTEPILGTGFHYTFKD